MDPDRALAASGFNPRICKRCDDHIGYQPIYLKVSIHASVKDATLVLTNLKPFVLFQSTHL